jgi:hypothetical protein
MDDFRSIVACFPQREFDIRRRCARDPRFKSICADYEEAARALGYWQKIAQAGNGQNEADRKVEEYTSFLGELEAEILAHLDRSISNGRWS